MPTDIDRLLASAAAEPSRDLDPAALRARAARARRRGRVVTGLAIAAVLLVVVPLVSFRGPDVELVPGGQDASSRLALPEPGTVRADVLADGAPVFVVAHEDGGVSVLSAISPRLDLFPVFCPSDRTFWDPHHGSRWDERGRYMGGPSPEGLTPYDAQVEQTAEGRPTVVVGPRRSAPGREVPPFTPSGPPCDWIAGHASIHTSADGGVGHDLAELYGGLRDPGDSEAEASDYARYDARIAAAGGKVTVCSPRAEDGCPDGSPTLVSLFHDQPHRDFSRCTGHIDAELLARRTPAGFADAAISPGVAGLGKTTGQGFDDHMDCPPIPFPDPVASVTGVLSAVEAQGDTWVAVLSEPASPEPLDGKDPQSATLDPTPRRHFTFDAAATVRENDMLDGDRLDPATYKERGPGEQLPQRSFRPEDLNDLIAERGPLPIQLTLLPDGTITSGLLNPLEPPNPNDSAPSHQDAP